MSATTSSQLQLRVDPRTDQRRARVALRLFLAVPQFIVLTFIGYAAEFLALLGWFAALVTRRNPFHRFIVGYIRWYARVLGYLYLLTDSYPPFSLEPSDDYPIDVSLDQSPLRRFAVLFRIVLLVPFALVTTLLSAGLSLVAVVAWFLTLIRGSLPTPLHDATHAALRYLLRVQAYALVVQDRYPRGLYGDASATEAAAGRASSTEHDDESDAEVSRPLVRPETVAPTQLLGTLATAPSAGGDEAAPRGPLALSRAARRVLTGELVLGTLAYVGTFLLIVALGASLTQGRIWSNLYGGDLASLRLVLSTTSADLRVASPRWETVRRDCTNVEQSLARLTTLPQYPRKGPNAHLLKGLGYAALGDRACLASIVPHHQASLLPDLGRAFAAALHELTVFDHETR